MMRLNRLLALQHVVRVTERGEWHDLGKATSHLRSWFLKHELVTPQPNPNDPAWPSFRHVQATEKGRESARVASAEHNRHCSGH